MNQALDAGLEFDERAEFHQARDRAAHAIAGDELLRHRIPGMRLQLLQADGNAALVGISRELEDLYFDLLSYREHIRRLVDAAPGDVAHMQQSGAAAQIDESAVIGEAA